MADEYIRLDTTIMGIDGLINEAPTGSQARALLCAKDMIYDQQRYVSEMKPVKRGHWIEKSEEYYRLWQDSGRSWDDMPYFVTGLKFACSCCFNQYDVNAEGIEEWDFCPKCGADMREPEAIKG